MPTKRHPRQPSDGKLTLHELAIRSLVESDPRICRNGFTPAIRAAAEEAAREWYDEDTVPVDIRPDAYLIDRETKTITLFEVGDWRLATHDKEARLGWFWFWWDSYAPEWTLRCFAINRFGRFTHEMDLCGFYLDIIAEHAPRFRGALEGRSNARGG
jgi:hypothetical protein